MVNHNSYAETMNLYLSSAPKVFTTVYLTVSSAMLLTVRRCSWRNAWCCQSRTAPRGSSPPPAPSWGSCTPDLKTASYFSDTSQRRNLVQIHHTSIKQGLHFWPPTHTHVEIQPPPQKRTLSSGFVRATFIMLREQCGSCVLLNINTGQLLTAPLCNLI